MVDGSSDVVRLRLRDGAERAVTHTSDRDETWPYWSDAAGSLVFQVSRGPGDSDLVLWTEEEGERALVATPEREERWPAWSPRRPELVYAFRGGHPPSGLALGSPEPGEPRLLAEGGPRDVFLRPSWAPDGAAVVAQRRSASGTGSELWVLRSGAGPEPLLRDPRWADVKPCFSRDARRILFSRRPASGGPHDILSVDAAGGDPRVLASLPDADDHSARPSPTRDEMAFVSDRDGMPQIYLANLDGGELRRLGPPGRSAFAPRWSPDGERLVATLAPVDVPLRLNDPASLARARVVVLDRRGSVLLEAPGLMADWMPPWP
jgi:Tol biopolymer transport system component